MTWQRQKMAEARRWQRRWAEKYRSGSAASEALLGGGREKIAAGARRKHIGRWQEKIAAGARRKLALSSARASMLLGSKLRGGRWYSNRGATLIPSLCTGWKGRGAPCSASPAQRWREESPPMALEGSLNPREGEDRLVARRPHSDLFLFLSHRNVQSDVNNCD